MRVLITGGTGFIGSRLALRCLANGDSVRVLGQENTPAEIENRQTIEKQGAEVILTAVNDEKVIGESVRDIDVVFHLAAAQHEANVPDQIFGPVRLGLLLFHAAILNFNSLFSNHLLLSAFLLSAVIDASATEPGLDQLMPLCF